MSGSAPLFGSEQTIVQVDIAAERLGGNRAADGAFAGDVAHAVRDVRAAWRRGSGDREAWLDRSRALAAASLAFWDQQIDGYTGTGVHPGAVARSIAASAAERFGGDVSFVADGGDALSWALAYFYAEKPGRL